MKRKSNWNVLGYPVLVVLLGIDKAIQEISARITKEK